MDLVPIELTLVDEHALSPNPFAFAGAMFGRWNFPLVCDTLKWLADLRK